MQALGQESHHLVIQALELEYYYLVIQALVLEYYHFVIPAVEPESMVFGLDSRFRGNDNFQKTNIG